MKLWQKGYTVNAAIEDYTVGEDYKVDQALVQWDCIGSIAHAAMLTTIGILTKDEFRALKKELKNIIALHKQGSFAITKEDEDVHTAVENHLTKKCGEIGKKIHTARSRNDQVLVDIRLFSKDHLHQLMQLTLALAAAFTSCAEKHKDIPMPGYTHMRKAMISSVGLWAGAFAESLFEDMILLNGAYALNDQCPLGSAAGYGVNLPIDRECVVQALGFTKVQNNVLYVQNSRGKIELSILQACSHIMHDLNKAAVDLCLFSMPEFGYFTLPDEFTTGSSIMPQKKNPDVLELVRASAHIIDGYIQQITSLIQNLPSGYNRDFQLTKKVFIDGMSLTEKTIAIMIPVIQKLNVNEKKCQNACTPELFAADYANTLVQQGVPFRKAYQEVAKKITFLKKIDAQKALKERTHIGGPGNLNLKKLHGEIVQRQKVVSQQQTAFEQTIQKLLV